MKPMCLESRMFFAQPQTVISVSYTHLDVYKRQDELGMDKTNYDWYMIMRSKPKP